MTIAGFYLSPEGLVFGADSTASVANSHGFHYFDFTQKVFEIGEDSTLGFLTWGMGAIGNNSYRTLLALLSDGFKAAPITSITEVTQRWLDMVWGLYDVFPLVVRCRALHQKPVYDPNAQIPDPNARTQGEEEEYNSLKDGLVVGFCIGGYVMPTREPEAAHVIFDPLSAKPTLTLHQHGAMYWWGVPNIIHRLILGADANLTNAIMQSGHWSGTQNDLDNVLQTQRINPTITLPIRDAVDYVHACIQCTIKAMKFSNLPQVCGGPIEIAVITTDRSFRWVRHKPWDAAITDGGL